MNESLPRVLVVDDERAIRRLLTTALSEKGYSVFEASTAAEALEAVPTYRPDIVILDICLPDSDGIEVTRLIRQWSLVPIVVLSVREDEKDKIAALDAGADDYLTKPFGIEEMFARMRAALRRVAPTVETESFRVGKLEVNLLRRRVRLADHDIALTPTEYDLLKAFISHPGRVLTHRHLLRSVWGEAYEEDVHLLRVHMSNLRNKIETDPLQPLHIITVAGVGYRLQTDS